MRLRAREEQMWVPPDLLALAGLYLPSCVTFGKSGDLSDRMCLSTILQQHLPCLSPRVVVGSTAVQEAWKVRHFGEIDAS